MYQSDLQTILTTIFAISFLSVIIPIIILICVLSWLKRTSENTEDIARILSEMDKNNQIRYKNILEELKSINKNNDEK